MHSDEAADDEDDDDEDEEEREPPVDMMDGAEDVGDSSAGDPTLVVISMGAAIFLCDLCSKFFRNSETFG